MGVGWQWMPRPFSPSPGLCLPDHQPSPCVVLCLLSRMCSPQWQSETVTGGDLDLAVLPLSGDHRCCRVEFCGVVMVIDAASFSSSNQAPDHMADHMWAFFSAFSQVT